MNKPLSNNELKRNNKHYVFDKSFKTDYIDLYIKNNLSFFPIKKGTKQPLIPWKEYQQRKPTEQEIKNWFKKYKDFNIAIVTGSVSENLVVLDFDSKDTFQIFSKQIFPKLTMRLQNMIKYTWKVRTGKGLHIYLKIENEQQIKTMPRLIDGLDIKAEGGYVVAPPSLHPSGKRYVFVEPPTIIQKITNEEWKNLLNLLKPIKEKQDLTNEREKTLRNTDILSIVDILREVYVAGYRDLIIFFLTGWLKKANIAYESVKQLVETLAENDEEKDHRLLVVDRTFKGENVDIKGLKGKSGLQEIIEKQVGEQKALDIIKQIEDILGVSSPYKDAIFAILDYEKKIFAVSNPRANIIARCKRVENGGMRYKEKIAFVSLGDIVVYEDPSGGARRFKIHFDGIKSFDVGPATVDEILEELGPAKQAVVQNKRLISDVLVALLNEAIRKGKAKKLIRFPETGYFLYEKTILWNDGIVKTKMPKIPDIEQAKKALEILNELVISYFKREPTQITGIALMFSTPFGHIRKMLGRNQQVIAFAGEANTYKTTIAMLGPLIFGLDHNSIDAWRTGYVTYPQLANGGSRHTGAFVINEAPLDIFTIKYSQIIAYLKGAPETLAGRFLENDKETKKALSTIVFTFNDIPTIGDPNIANPKRLLLLRFENSKKISQGGKKLIQENINAFHHLAGFLRDHINEIPLDMFSDPLPILGKNILSFLYEKLLGKIPDWINFVYDINRLDPTDRFVEETMTLDLTVISLLVEDAKEAIRKLPTLERDTLDVSITSLKPEDIIRVIKSNLLPYALYRTSSLGYNVIWLLPPLKRKIREKYDWIVTLADIAKAVNGEVAPRKIIGKSQKVIVIREEELKKLLGSFFDVETRKQGKLT